MKKLYYTVLQVGDQDESGVRQIPYFHALSEKRIFYTVASARWIEVAKNKRASAIKAIKC